MLSFSYNNQKNIVYIKGIQENSRDIIIKYLTRFNRTHSQVVFNGIVYDDYINNITMTRKNTNYNLISDKEYIDIILKTENL